MVERSASLAVAMVFWRKFLALRSRSSLVVFEISCYILIT